MTARSVSETFWMQLDPGWHRLSLCLNAQAGDYNKVQTAKPPLLVKKLPKIKIRPPPKNKKKPLTFFNNIILSRFSETTNLNFSMEYLDNDIDKNYQFGGRFHVKMCTF